MFEELFRGLNLDQHGRAKPAGSWRRGGAGDHDWETMNCMLVAEWLRFGERMVENVTTQVAKHGMSPPPDWREMQVHRFKSFIAKRYDGQAYPAADYLHLHEDRIAERHGAEAVDLFRAKWRAAT